MTLSGTLREVTHEAQEQNELPDYLALRIFAIADQLLTEFPVPEGVEELIEQIQLYDTFGQTGYLGMGVNHLILEKTIERVEARLADRA